MKNCKKINSPLVKPKRINTEIIKEYKLFDPIVNASNSGISANFIASSQKNSESLLELSICTDDKTTVRLNIMRTAKI